MELKFIFLCIFLFFVTNNLSVVESGNILSIQIFTSKSHKISYEPMLIELAKRGHNVTVVNSEPSPKRNPPIPNLHEIRAIDIIGSLEEFNFFEERIKKTENASPFDVLVPLLQKYCPEFYELEVIQQILKEKYDLVMIEPFFNECLFGMFHHFNTTSVFLNTFDTPFWYTNSIGLITLPSYMPTFPLGFNENMNFWERLANFCLHVFMEINVKYTYYPKMEEIYRKYLGANTPSIPELMSRISLIMDNSDLTLAIARPTMPEIVRFGGMHCRKPVPLSKDLEDFAKDAPHGFIFFSMGSIVKPKQMPETHRQMFLNVFSKLKQKVIWKWGDDTMDDLPPNVIVRKWLPQQDILGHRNIRLFISHGGLLSTQETLCHGVPIIGIPMYGDQPVNVEAATKRGFGMKWDLVTLTEEYMLESINEMLNNKSYTENVKKLSNLHKDRQVEPVDRAVFAVEYVMRHNGFPFKSPARNLNWIQYFCLDIIGFIFLVLITSLLVIFLSVKFACKRMFRKSSAKLPKQKKK